MSDDDEYYDDDEYFYIDEGPVADADDLAEHTMHSPVWQEHPSYDTADYWSDWEYYSDDDYYDQASPKRKRQRIAGEGITEAKDKVIEGSRFGKRRRLRPTEDVPELSLGESLDSDTEESAVAKPVIVWRMKEAHDPVESPIVTEGEGEKVALLKDWRERFVVATKPGRNIAADEDLKTQKPNRVAVAVVIGPQQSASSSSRVTAPTVSSKAKNMPSKAKVAPRHANEALISKPSTAKAKAPVPSTTNGIKPSATTKNSSHSTAVLGQRANGVETIGKKRSRPGPDERVTAGGDESISRKRRAPAPKEKENEAVQSANQSDASSISGRKRKAPDDVDETNTPQPVKRKAAALKTVTAASEPKKRPTVPTRRNTRSKDN